MQQKDVIYIDVEDDITAIIGKVKASKEKIVALVPPKRTGVLQSAVNLRLLARTADTADKRLVLITNNAALSGLAASAKIPVAKNLQSRPELAEIPVLEVDDDDVIDGEQLPVGDHAGTADEPVKSAVPASSISGIDIDGDTSPTKPKSDAKPKAKRGVKVPDFGSFRKRMALGIGGGILLILFFVWAIVYAPRATVVISAKTSNQNLMVPVTLGANQTTDSEKTTIKSVTKQEKITQSVDFDATGTKDVGDKAKGQVKMSALTQSPISIPAGTQLQSGGGQSFTTDSSAVIPASVPCFPTYCAQSVTVNVTAAESGTDYNNISGSLSGAPSGASAQMIGSTSGGTSKVVKVVQQADVEKAKQQIADQSTDDVKKKLQGEFGSDVMVIDGSFTVTAADAQSTPAINAEAPSGKAKLTREMTYTMMGVSKSELGTYLDASLKKTLTNASEQRIYDNGQSTAKFTEFKAGDNGTASASLTAVGQIGPKINDDQIKSDVKGKRTGEVIGDLKAIDGVSDVSVNLSPFWVTSIPNDINKISVEFKLIKNE